MKNRIGVIVLVLVFVCVGLGIALIAIKKQAGEQQRDYAEKNSALSNNLVQTSDQLDRQKQVNAELYSRPGKAHKGIRVR